MKLVTRRICLPALIVLTLTSSIYCMTGRKIAVPDFNGEDCIEFRRRLVNHTLLSFYDRKHSTNLGIAGMSLFWTGLPAVPLGIAAAWTGNRQSTDAVEELVISGVTDENYEEVNRLCAILLGRQPVIDATLDGRNRTAVILGAASTALSLFVFVLQCCFGVFALWNWNSYDDEDDGDDDLIEEIENMMSNKVNRRLGTEGLEGGQSKTQTGRKTQDSAV